MFAEEREALTVPETKTLSIWSSLTYSIFFTSPPKTAPETKNQSPGSVSLSSGTTSQIASHNFSIFCPPKIFHQKGEEKIELVALNPALRFRDGSTPVFYQEKNPVILTIMKYHEAKLNPRENSLILEDGYLPTLPPYTGLTLIPLSTRKWIIYNGKNDTFEDPIPGSSYAFITMPDKSIRVAVCAQAVHAMLSNSLPAVRYAGNLTFEKEKGKENEIAWWDNYSGAYRPSAHLADQAGFQSIDTSKFKPFRETHENNLPSRECKGFVSPVESPPRPRVVGQPVACE